MQNGSNHMGEVFFALCKAIDTPVSLSAWLRWKYSQKELSSFSIRALDYDDVERFRKDYLVTEYLSKYAGLETSIDTKSVALAKFKQCEEQNLETNQRLKGARVVPTGTTVDSVFHTARRIMANILGPLNVSKVLSSPRWSPGATSTLSRRRARVDTKMLTLPIAVTRRALPYFRAILHDDLHWCASLLGTVPEGPFSLLKDTFEIVTCNRVVTVPKNAKTDRVIAAEPTANIFLQKSVGTFIRRRLRSFGVDLDNQQTNQRMAGEAFYRDLATLDLSSASDTISLELVYELLPVDWANFLADLRTPEGVLPDGSRISYQKFSSMGNGFTFELESAIFYSLVSACHSLLSIDEPPYVYGDDIITPVACVPLVREVFRFAGFTLNEEKSHYASNFRESCGKHYFCGIDVTPIYQKEVPQDLPSWIRLGNRLIRSFHRYPYYRGAWLAARRIGGGNEFALPLGTEGDDGWLVPLDDFQPRRSCRNRGFQCHVIRFKPLKVRANEAAIYAYRLRQQAETQALLPVSSEPPIDEFRGYITVDNVKRWTRSLRWVWSADYTPIG